MRSARAVVAYLEGRGMPCALIGGVALGVHGVARATLDTDLLVSDPVLLDPAFWSAFSELGPPEIRRGDADDPLLGVVRFPQAAEPVDIVVGRLPWTRQILERRIYVVVEGQRLPIVNAADLVLLKLYAGGPQDLLDVELLLAADPGLRQAVETSLCDAPLPVRELWERVGKD